MTNEDITRMAREAGLERDGYWEFDMNRLARFASLVYEATFHDANIAASKTILDAAVLEEREACAKVCDDNALKVAAGLFRRGQNDYFGGHYFARAIRARSKP